MLLPARLVDALRRASGRPPRYVDECGPAQRAFITDPSGRKSSLCGRRAGKSSGAARWLLAGMEERPGTRSVYVALSGARARQILWDGILRGTSRRYGLGLRERVKAGQLMLRHPNGSTLWLAGCGDRSEVDKFRGEPFYRVVVDEAQAFPDYLQELVEDAVEPSLMDLEGQLALCGTPSAVPTGYFWEVTTGQRQGWGDVHHWTALDNPHLPQAAAWLEKKRLSQCWGPDHPTYVREYLGKWVKDVESLIYPFSEENDFVPAGPGPFGLPPGRYDLGLGVDLGWSDRSTAFVLCAARRGHGEVYVLRVWKRSRVAADVLAEICRAARAEVLARAGETLRVVVDEGGIGGGFTDQLRRLGVGCEAAEKTKKAAHQSYVASLVRSRRLRVHRAECGPLLEEAARLQWDRETGREDEAFVRHACDAALYVVRALFPLTDEAPSLAVHAPGSPEALNAEMAARKERMMQAVKQSQSRSARRPR